MSWSCVRLYAAPIVVFLEALFSALVDSQIWVRMVGLMLLAVGLAVSIREQRRLTRERRRKR